MDGNGGVRHLVYNRTMKVVGIGSRVSAASITLVFVWCELVSRRNACAQVREHLATFYFGASIAASTGGANRTISASRSASSSKRRFCSRSWLIVPRNASMHALRSATKISNRLTHWFFVLKLGISFEELELCGVELALQVGGGARLPRHGDRRLAQFF